MFSETYEIFNYPDVGKEVSGRGELIVGCYRENSVRGNTRIESAVISGERYVSGGRTGSTATGSEVGLLIKDTWPAGGPL